MAKTRVSELAKEFGMSGKEMLGYLKEMMIPAKTPSSTLEDAYVAMVRKKLKPILEARAAEIEAAKKAEEEAKAAAEREAAEKAEKERLAAEERRERERKAAAEAQRRAEEARKKAEEEKAAEEARRKAEEEARRPKDTAPKTMPTFTSLLDQIAQQEEVLAQQAAEASAKKEEARGERRSRSDEGKRARRPEPADADAGAPSRDESNGRGRGRGRKGRRDSDDDGDRYSRMARAAEEYNREHVLEEARQAVAEANEESTGRRRRRKERRKQQKAEAEREQRIEQAIENDQDLSQLDTIKVPTGTTVAQLADLIHVPANDIIKRLFLLGTPLTMTQSMSDDLIELVAEDLGVDVKVMSKEEENSFTFYDDPDSLKPRSPVVTVMGHVDHGKTSLLDAIRETNVTAKEAGGITQRIGAYMVETNGHKITFLDTPGHEAFTAMRMRGAQSTDIAVLVVAADDGVMPQTEEAINHAKAAGVDLIVAINKMDKPGANPDRVKQELSQHGILTEDWGGDVPCVEVSAKTKQGIPELLDMILLVAEVKELRANPNRNARGLVIEASLDKGRGPVATILIQKGTLHVGDPVAAGHCFGKVRAMTNENGRRLKEAGPSTPVEIIGLNDVPSAGEVFMQLDSEKEARSIADTYIAEGKKVLLEGIRKPATLDGLFAEIQAGNVKELPIIVKADVQGSVEAVKQSLVKLSNEEVAIKVIHSGVGAITESDASLASASGAIIIGFNVRPDATAKSIVDREKLDMRLYKVIYQAIDDVEAAMKGLLEPIYEERVIGHGVVRQTFKASKVGTIAGTYILDGKFTRGCKARITRDGEQIFDGEIISLKRFKDDVKDVNAGYECGVVFDKFEDLREEDTIEAYAMVEVPRS